MLRSVALFCALPAEQQNRLTTQQGAIKLLADFVQSGPSQSEDFAVQNGKGMKEREGDNLDPEQRQHRHGMMMGAMSQVPVLRQFAKGVVFYLLAQVPQVPNGRAVKSVQVSGYHSNPVLFLLLTLPLLADPLTLRPALPHFDDPYRLGVSVGETHRTQIPNLDLTPIPLHLLGRF